MKNNKKIALISVKTHNYGSLLQTYALQKFLNNQEINNEIIAYREKNIFRQIYRLCQISFLIVYSKGLFRNVYLRFFQPDLYKKLKIRACEFNGFISKKLVFSKPFEGRKSLVKSANNYTAFILGSDQVWHPDNMRMDYYNMNFVPAAIPKVAYAPSFGVSKIPEAQRVNTIKYLNRIKHISVREQSGKDIVFKLTGKMVQVVCDPTLLIDKDEWDGLKGDNRIIEQKYIFCYFLGNNSLHREFTNRLKKHTGLQIVTLPHMHEYVPGDDTFGDIAPFNIGPSEFINLISNAEYVLTDSFHGTIFSIIYSKNFYTLDRFDENKSSSTNTRIDSILSLLNIKGRKINGNEQLEDVLNKSIDYKDVYVRLIEFKKISIKYLVDAISEIGIKF